MSVAYPRTIPHFGSLEIISPQRKIRRFLHDYLSQPTWPHKSSLTKLVTKKLRQPIDVVVEPDGDNYLARCPALPLYGYGASEDEAIEMLKREIESVYEDLMEDDSFTDDWKPIKDYLEERIN